MPFDAGAFGQNVAESAIGAGMGLLLGQHNDKRQIRQQEKLQALQIRGQKEMTDYNSAKQYEMWLKTNYPAQVEQLEKAGLNTALMYGMSGGGGTTTGSASGNVTGASAPAGGGEVQALAGMGLQLGQIAAQNKLLEAQARNLDADTENKSGVTRENIAADTQNKILQQVINDFAGKEAKDTYERIMAPNRSVQAKTYEDEMAARQGVAGTIYDLWVDGKLAEKSTAEVEKILLDNAKTREETRSIYKQIEILEENLKGAKLDNIIKDLETKLQTQTGIDRSSPAWMKILGRLFVGLLNK